MHDSQSHEAEKYDPESRETRNQERLCWQKPAAVYLTSLSWSQKKNMVTGPAEPETKNDSADEGQQQITRSSDEGQQLFTR
jgi:hypothetical protein